MDQNLNTLGKDITPLRDTSSVLLLISDVGPAGGRTEKPYLILTKRSESVRQPGDLCFPGGGAAPRFDMAFAKLLTLPGFPFANWRRRRTGEHAPINHRRLPHYLATSLRESFEEMRLVPIGLDFLGPLPPHRLVLYDRVIYPMVAWARRRQFFRANGEVEKVVFIPLKALLDSNNYAYFRLVYPPNLPVDIDTSNRDTPCFIHQHQGENEVLWGATYRIVETFLAQVFDFSSPGISDLPRINNHLATDYFPTRG